jgi:sugar lactone lactonase YvrE
MTTAALALDVRAELGEGPVWDSIAACLYFVDILRGRVHRFDPATSGCRTYDLGARVGSVGAVALTADGDLLLAARDGFARLSPSTGEVSTIAALEGNDPDVRMNDGSCDPAGRFWAGTMALDERPGAGALYRLDSNGRVHTMLRDVSISNGLDWSDDRLTMYYIDSPTQSVDVFDFDDATGSIGNRRTFVRIAADEGTPDGLTLDAEGFLWVALWGGWTVHRYAPDGSRDAVVRLPTAYPTSCAFGGADLRDLYITTAAIKLSDRERHEQPGAGGLFCCRPGVAGRQPHRFANR